MFRNALVRTLWAAADLLQVVQGGLIVLASKAVTSGETKAW